MRTINIFETQLGWVGVGWVLKGFSLLLTVRTPLTRQVI